MGATKLRVSTTIVSILISIIYVARQVNTSYETNTFSKRSYAVSRGTKRSEGNYVVLDTEYSFLEHGNISSQTFTNVTFGGTNNEITLSISNSDTTWVPQLPSSVTDFCSRNQQACAYADKSGYYRPNGVSRRDNFSILDSNFEESIDGYWVEDTAAAGGKAVTLGFGVATSWKLRPFLGLGFKGVWNPDLPNDKEVHYEGNRTSIPPTYLDTLFQQGKITSRTCSFYNIIDTKSPGQIILGAVDRDKFSGEFATYDWISLNGTSDFGGRIPDAPAARISNLIDPGNSTSYFRPPSDLTTQISPFFWGLYLPDYIFNPLTDALKPFGAVGIDIGKKVSEGRNETVWSIPCDASIPSNHVIELKFSTVAIRIPLDDLIARDVRYTYGSASISACALFFYSHYEMAAYYASDPTKPDFPMILGGPFFK
ncbi:hypothetical protein TWF481_011615 [Arthrobotrys musiformis]|uniref:Peptidase A1 domain-containing protein n=1 Tax=Arthrobotrys musiformis TaxID=47236 RepID=A0AAV9VYU7_9PEZI